MDGTNTTRGTDYTHSKIDCIKCIWFQECFYSLLGKFLNHEKFDDEEMEREEILLRGKPCDSFDPWEDNGESEQLDNIIETNGISYREAFNSYLYDLSDGGYKD